MSKNKYENVWNFPSSPWKTETAFLTWLRGSIRRIWSKHPVKLAYKNGRRYKAPVGINGKEVWVSDCEICKKQCRKCEVDHIDGGYGFTDWDSFCKWQKRILLVSFDDIRELCEDCHGAVTYSQKQGVSFEEAKAIKKAIEIQKSKGADVIWLKENEIVPASNATRRKEQIVQKLLEGDINGNIC